MAERVLITGARAAAALDLARDFRAAGFEPHLADCSPARVSRWSRAAAGFHRYPSPVADGPGFRARIGDLADRLDARLVVPVCEEVFHLAAPALADRLGARLFAPPLAVLRGLHDKLAFARSWGLPVPESHPLDDPSAFAGDSGKWVFKPRFSRFGEAALVGPSRELLERLAIGPGQPWLAQRRVVGEEACFQAVALDGRLTAFAAYRSDWRLGGGASFAFQALDGERADALRDLAARLAQAAAITGQFACDAIFDAKGQPWLIECNPRATSGVHLLAGEGRLARAILGEEADIGPRVASAHLAPAMVVYGLPLALRRHGLGAWRGVMSAGHDVLARPGDRRPLLGALADTAGFTLSAWRRAISTSAATTRDIEWNGEDLP